MILVQDLGRNLDLICCMIEMINGVQPPKKCIAKITDQDKGCINVGKTKMGLFLNSRCRQHNSFDIGP